MMPGDIIYINGRSIAIGATGSFFLENEDIQSIQIIAGRPYIGQITYSYEDTTSNTAQTVIGCVKSITKNSNVAIADVEINAKIADKFNEQEYYLQVLTRFNKDENITRVTGYRLIKISDYENIMKAKKQNKAARKQANKKN